MLEDFVEPNLEAHFGWCFGPGVKEIISMQRVRVSHEAQVQALSMCLNRR